MCGLEPWLFWTLAVLGVAAAVSVLVAAFATHRPLRALLAGAVQGLCSLAAVNVAGAFTGISLGLNTVNLVAVSVLGIPGTVTLLLLKVIFGIGLQAGGGM